MVRMTEKSKRFLMQYVPELKEADHPNDILGPLYDIIIDKGFISQEAGYNDFGREAQEVYDDIFYGNFDE